jgi:hypothetical protein
MCRVFEQAESEAFHLLDHLLGVHGVAVVDDEADGERRSVLAHLTAEVFRRNSERSSSRAEGGCAQGRVEGDVAVAAPREPVARVLPLASPHERACPPPDRTALELVFAPCLVEGSRDVDVEPGDGGRADGAP